MKIDRSRSHQSHRSYPSYVAGAWQPAALALLLLFAGRGLCADPAGRKPLPETTVLSNIDGKLVHADANDTWLFELASDAESAGIKVPAGTRFPLLPSAVLERLIADANDRYTPRYRLSASVTRYEAANFLLPTYYLPLSKFKNSVSPETAQEPNGVSEPVGPSDPNLTVPEEILEQLRNRPPLRGPLRNPQAKPVPFDDPQSGTPRSNLGRMLVDRIGVIERRGGFRTGGSETRPYYVFIPSGLGWQIGNTAYELLPCAALELVLMLQMDPMEPTRFDIAGFITRFKGKEYLLLHRAVPVYNYGNFGR